MSNSSGNTDFFDGLSSIAVGITLFIFVIGVFFNAAAFIIVGRIRKSLSSSALFYLRALAIMDSLALVFDGFIDPLKYFIGQDFGFNYYVCIIEMTLDYVTTFAANWMIVFLTFDRFLAVVCPHFYRNHSSSKRIAVYVTVIGIGLVYLINSPVILMSYVKTKNGKCKPRNDLFYFWLITASTLSNAFISVFAVLTLNILLIRTIIRNKLFLADLHVERRMTKIIIIISVTFLMLAIPSSLITCFHVYVHIAVKESNYVMKSLGKFGDNFDEILRSLNNSINFFLYLFVSKRIREEICTVYRHLFALFSDDKKTTANEIDDSNQIQTTVINRSYHTA